MLKALWFVFFISPMALAQGVKTQKKHLYEYFLNGKQVEFVIHNANIIRVKHLFDDYFLVHAKEKLPVFQSDTKKLSLKRKFPSVEEKAPSVFTSSENSLFFLNDPYLSKQWFLQGEDKFGISLLKAFHKYPEKGKSPVLVAVIDTGIDYLDREHSLLDFHVRHALAY